jgi:hypothetical protein
MKSSQVSIKKVFSKFTFQSSKSDFAFWQTQSYPARLATLEEIRQEYNRWRQSAEQGFQRVYKITKR